MICVTHDQGEAMTLGGPVAIIQRAPRRGEVCHRVVPKCDASGGQLIRLIPEGAGRHLH
jgi:ABC-type nitrate/sulfonate/bicarbonate transport system ATPase subunit